MYLHRNIVSGFLFYNIVNGVDSVPVSDEDKAPEVAPEPPNDSSENEILQKENEEEDGEIAAEPEEGDVVASRWYGYPFGGNGYGHYLGKRSEEGMTMK